MRELLHKLKENKLITHFVYLFIVATILSIPLIDKNIDIYLDDGSQHLMRSYGTYQSIIQNGNGIVISNFVNGFGYSWNLFYGPLSTYFLMFLGIIFGSFNLGFKILFLLNIFLTGIFMYKLVYEITDNRNTALLSGIIYMTSPYFFTDIYVRHALRRMHFIYIYTTSIFRIISFI